MRTSIIAIIAGVLFSSAALAQNARFDYVDEYFQPVDQGEAAFTRKAVQDEDGYYQVHIHFLDGKTRMSGRYCDESLQREDGWFVYYFYAGHKESEGSFLEGEKIGSWSRWDWTGKELPSRFYKESPAAQPELISKAATFPGGHQALQEYIADNLKYPKAAIALNRSGYVEVAFTISEKGNIRNVELLQGGKGVFATEGRRLVENMPRWEPAIKNGQHLESKFILPITFEMTPSPSVP